MTGLGGAMPVLAGAAAAAMIAAAAPPSGPSFACASARSFAERAVCASPELSGQDRGLAQDYAALLRMSVPSTQAALRAGQRAWIAERDRCATGACVAESYRRRREELMRLMSRPDPQAPRRLTGQFRGRIFETKAGAVLEVAAPGSGPR